MTRSAETFPIHTRFLVVDDSQMMRKIVQQTLHRLGYMDIELASDGHEALAKLNSAAFMDKPFDIVLADLWMLDMNGFNLLKACRSNPELKVVDFILVTAERDKKYITQALNEGASAYIFKPLDEEILRRKLRDLFQEIEEPGSEEEAQQKKVEAKSRALETELENAPKSLEQDQLQALINALPGFAARVTSEGKITEVNHYLRAKYNLSAKELITPEIIESIFSSAANRSTYETKIAVMEETHYFYLVSQRFLENTEAVIIGISITSQKRAEEKLRGLVSQLGSVEEMAGGIAHKLNIPLLVIHTRTSRLQKLAEADAVDKKGLLESVAKIETSVVQIKKIIKGLTTFAREGEKDPFVEISVGTLLEEILEFFRARFSENGIALAVGEIPKQMSIECREAEILQVLLNLLNNAHDAVGKLKEKWVRIEVQDRGDDVEISVTDSGAGIPETVREKILLPFFTTKEAGKGTGLGLSICKSILESHGGSLALDARFPNTRFVIRLPKRRLL